MTKGDITLVELLDPKLHIDHILTILNNLNFKPGSVLKILGNIARTREYNENAQNQIIEIVNAIKFREREIAEQKKIQQEGSENSTITKNIFISYSWSNKSDVRKLHSILVEKGFNCWLDENKMQAGNQLFEEIDKGVTKCQVFIACCSNNYSNSVNCQREIVLACDRKKLVIPVLIAPCATYPPIGSMGPLLAGKLYIDLSSDDKFEKTVEQLLTAINQCLV